jgi:hypothetical protein
MVRVQFILSTIMVGLLSVVVDVAQFFSICGSRCSPPFFLPQY